MDVFKRGKFLKVMDIKVEKTFPADYEQFLEKCDSRLIYSTPQFMSFLEGATGSERLILVAESDGQTTGVLPLCIKRVNAGLLLNSLPWFGTYGGCLVVDHADESVKKALLDKYFLVQHDMQPLSSTLIVSPFDDQELYIDKLSNESTIMEERICQISCLPEDGDFDAYLSDVIHQKTRNLVRKANKQGFDLLVDDGDAAWDALYKIHVLNMEAIGGKGKPKTHFDLLRNNISVENRKIFLARCEGNIAAALLMLFYNKTAEYITPVIRHEYRSMQPLSYLIWEAMKDASGMGMQYWNWGGTWKNQENLHHFKAGWGAVDYNYNYFVSCSGAGKDLIRKDINSLAKAAPYFYIFPYRRL